MVANLGRLGITVAPARNEAPSRDARVISPDGSPVTVLVVPYDVLTDLVRQNNRLARELSVEIDQRKEAVEVAREQAEGSTTRPVTSSVAARA